MHFSFAEDVQCDIRSKMECSINIKEILLDKYLFQYQILRLRDRDWLSKSDPYILISRPSTTGSFQVLERLGY